MLRFLGLMYVLTVVIHMYCHGSLNACVCSTFLPCVGVPGPPCCFFSSSSCVLSEVTLALFCRRSFDSLASHDSFSTWATDDTFFTSHLIDHQWSAQLLYYNNTGDEVSSAVMAAVKRMFLFAVSCKQTWLNSNLTFLSLLLCRKLLTWVFNG